jgi:hypothetical protein
MINVYTKAVIEINENQWFMLYEEESKNILIEPQQSSGFYTVVDILVVADSKEELDQYILENKLSSVILENKYYQPPV